MKIDNSSPITGLILPGDSIPEIGMLRKQLLLFDSISLIDSSDDFLVHKGEVHDKTVETMGELVLSSANNERAVYKGGTWDNTIQFPKHEAYTDDFKKIVEDAFQPLKKGLIGVVNTRNNKKINHVVNWHLYKSLSALPNVLKAAVPDVNTPKILTLDDGVRRICNVITPKSIFYTGNVSDSTTEILDTYWRRLASQRIARFVKAQQLAHSYQSCPVSVDMTNNLIAKEFHQIGHEEYFSTEAAHATSVSLDVVDSTELVNNLNNMSWKEFVSLRKAILPHVKKLRTYLICEIEKTNANEKYNIEKYYDSMQRLKKDFEKRKEDCANEWEKLRIASILKLGGGVGSIGLVQGANVLPLPSSVESTIAYALSLAALAPAAINAELKTYLPARRRFKNHPLHFTENLTNL